MVFDPPRGQRYGLRWPTDRGGFLGRRTKMRGLKWCLWIVGIIYVLEGGGLTLLRLFDPAAAAAVWTAGGDASQLDALALQAVLVPSLFVTLSWLVLGVLMLRYTRTPDRGRSLVAAVIALELFAWIPLDAVALTYGWSVPRGVTLLAIHLAIGIGGILALHASGGSGTATAS